MKKYIIFKSILLLFIATGLGLMPESSRAEELKNEEHNSEVKAPKLSAAEILTDLREGNKRFIEGVAKYGGKDSARRKELMDHESPSVAILSCSDSRVPPELIFDRGLGEVFTIRVAGNILGAASVASLEYAVEHLSVGVILVMGHESCGAVKAALGSTPGMSAGSPDLDTLVSSISLPEGKGRTIASVEDAPIFRKAVIFNVNSVAERLLQRSTIIRKRVEEGKVAIIRAIYGLETGKVDFWGVESLK